MRASFPLSSGSKSSRSPQSHKNTSLRSHGTPLTPGTSLTWRTSSLTTTPRTSPSPSKTANSSSPRALGKPQRSNAQRFGPKISSPTFESSRSSTGCNTLKLSTNSSISTTPSWSYHKHTTGRKQSSPSPCSFTGLGYIRDSQISTLGIPLQT